MAEQEASLRDALESAFTDDEDKAEPEVTEVKEDVVDEKTVVETVEKAEPAEEKQPVKAKAETERGPDGKFRPKAAPQEERKEVSKEEKPVAEAAKTRAPGSWNATAREKWGELPEDIQREVLRREKDIANGFTEIGKIRQFGQGMHDLWTPFQPLIAAEGGDAMKMTRDLFTTAAALYNGSPMQKVTVVAGMIKNFGIDLKMLDSILADGLPANGGGQPDFNAAVRQAVAQEIAPLRRSQEEAANAQQQEWVKEIEEFAQDPANEFFDDVKDTMADLISVADKKGQKLSLQDAYSRAILLHDDISAVVKARSAKADAAKKTAAAQAARKKAVSVAPNSPTAAAIPADEQSLHGDIADAIARLET